MTKKGGNSLTQSEMILISIYRVSAASTDKIPYEEIVIQAWRDFPEVFSLRNHPEHPDASDIHKRIYQNLKPKGLVVALRNKIFRLTEKGVEQAQHLIQELEGTPTKSDQEKLRLSRTQENFVKHALRSRAYATWRSDNPQSLIDYDAKIFFQFSTNTPVEERRQKVEFAKEAIAKARKTGMQDADELSRLAEFLSDNFRELF